MLRSTSPCVSTCISRIGRGRSRAVAYSGTLASPLGPTHAVARHASGAFDGQIDNDGTAQFLNVPPGAYRFHFLLKPGAADPSPRSSRTINRSKHAARTLTAGRNSPSRSRSQPLP